MSQLPVLEPPEAYRLWASSYPPYAHNPLMQAEERAMLALLPADLYGCNMLDAGCGSGRYIAHALRCGARSVVGVDLSIEMLRRAQTEALREYDTRRSYGPKPALIQAGLNALPIRDGWADITLCGLTLGHLPTLEMPLAELRRVTRLGGLLLCSDFHPAGEALGWQRSFKASGQRYAVRHTPHSLDRWQAACRKVGLKIERVQEPRLDPEDIPPSAKFDETALHIPVALVLALTVPGERIR